MPTTLVRREEEPFIIEPVEVHRPTVNDPRWCVFRKPGYAKLFEEITPNSDGSRNLWKSFEHYKRSVSTPSYLNRGEFTIDLVSNTDLWRGTTSRPEIFLNSSYGGFGNPDDAFYGLQGHYVKRLDGGFVPAPADLESLIDRSLQTMLPKIRSELSLINSVIELKDFRGLFRSALSKITNFRRTFRGALNKPLRQLVRSVPGGYLQYMFNLRPLISDISAIYRSVASVEKRLNDLVTREGRVRLQHFQCNLTEDDRIRVETRKFWMGYTWAYDPATGWYDGQFPIYTNVDNEQTIVTDPATFHAQIQYNYNYTDYQREHARVLALLDALGVNFNAAIIWNAIPWSFVVDWVLGVGRYLDKNKVGLMDPQINILQYLWSVKRQRKRHIRSHLTSNVYYSGTGRTDQYPPVSIMQPVVTETSYRRQVGLPGSSSIQSSGLSSTEFSLGAALVLARRRRPKRSR